MADPQSATIDLGKWAQYEEQPAAGGSAAGGGVDLGKWAQFEEKPAPTVPWGPRIQQGPQKGQLDPRAQPGQVYNFADMPESPGAPTIGGGLWNIGADLGGMLKSVYSGLANYRTSPTWDLKPQPGAVSPAPTSIKAMTAEAFKALNPQADPVSRGLAFAYQHPVQTGLAVAGAAEMGGPALAGPESVLGKARGPATTVPAPPASYKPAAKAAQARSAKIGADTAEVQARLAAQDAQATADKAAAAGYQARTAASRAGARENFGSTIPAPPAPAEAVAPGEINSVRDMANPAAQAETTRMGLQARPQFRAAAAEGKLSGPRTTSEMAPTTEWQPPDLTQRGIPAAPGTPQAAFANLKQAFAKAGGQANAANQAQWEAIHNSALGRVPMSLPQELATPETAVTPATAGLSELTSTGTPVGPQASTVSDVLNKIRGLGTREQFRPTARAAKLSEARTAMLNDVYKAVEDAGLDSAPIKQAQAGYRQFQDTHQHGMAAQMRDMDPAQIEKLLSNPDRFGVGAGKQRDYVKGQLPTARNAATQYQQARAIAPKEFDTAMSHVEAGILDKATKTGQVDGQAVLDALKSYEDQGISLPHHSQLKQAAEQQVALDQKVPIAKEATKVATSAQKAAEANLTEAQKVARQRAQEAKSAGTSGMAQVRAADKAAAARSVKWKTAAGLVATGIGLESARRYYSNLSSLIGAAVP